MLARTLADRLPRSAPPRRLAILTGARQVGKTTLAREFWGHLRYVNLDSPGERARLDRVPAESWGKTVGRAVLDEVQKSPSLLEKVKWAYDAGEIDFSVLLGSSRILLLDKVRESLAGRVFLYELWPLTVAELLPAFDAPGIDRPLIQRLVEEMPQCLPVLATLPPTLVGPGGGRARMAGEHLLSWGGLPPLLQYPAHERPEWLDAYQATYLERDLADVARLVDLEPFAKCHRLAALRAGRILSYSELARDAGLPVTTVRRYLRYLELSYQTVPLPAWSGNPGVRLVKSPKLIWFDAGVQRSLSGQLAGLTGEQYESAIAGQCLVTLWSRGLKVEPSYLRTAGGLEVDLLLERQDGILAMEIKNRPQVDSRDATAIERSRHILGDRYRGGLVVHRGDHVVRLTETVFGVPDWMLLGA
jgi:predicted AAA+ superfamily ATPase